MLTPSSPSSGHTLSTGPLDDFPPSYDEAEASAGGSVGAGGGESSSSARKWPESMDGLFAGPPNGEPLMTRDAASRLPNIKVHKEYTDRVEVCDKRLSDARALYDFIRSQAHRPPSVQIRCTASREETSQRQQTVMKNGMPSVVQAGEKYRITDFDFTIDLQPVFAHEDSSANVSITVKQPDAKLFRSARDGPIYHYSRQGNLSRAYGKFRRERGRPVWSDMAGDEEFWAQYETPDRPGVRLNDHDDEEALLGQQREEESLRYWCETYTNDPGPLKSIAIHKDIWGWDLANLRGAIERAILSTGYTAVDGTIDIEYKFGPDSLVIVRPDNILSRCYNFPSFLIGLLFCWLFPIIYLWKMVDPDHAGRGYETPVVSYGMKVYPPLPSTFANESLEAAQHRLPALYKLHPEIPKHAFLHAGPKGIHYLLGRREGEWFREWEERIRTAARVKFHGELTNTRIFDDEEPPELDGY